MPLTRRAAAGAEGLELLIRGCQVIKFSQKSGKAHAVALRLSQDEQRLTWQRHGLSKLKMKSDRRELVTSDVLEVRVGRDSGAFQHAPAGAKGAVHLSLSLVLRGERETFDLCCVDEEQFGLLVAAFRTLIGERDQRAAEEKAKHRPWGGGGPPIITAPPASAATSTGGSGAVHAALPAAASSSSPPAKVESATVAESAKVAELERKLAELQALVSAQVRVEGGG